MLCLTLSPIRSHSWRDAKKARVRAAGDVRLCFKGCSPSLRDPCEPEPRQDLGWAGLGWPERAPLLPGPRLLLAGASGQRARTAWAAPAVSREPPATFVLCAPHRCEAFFLAAGKSEALPSARG